MLQNALVLQIISAIFSLVLLVLGFYFLSKAEEDSKFYIISVIFFIATIVGAIYFLYLIFALTEWSFKAGVVAIIKVLIPFIIGAEIILYATDYIDDFDVQGITIFLIVVCTTLIIGAGGLIANFVQEHNYAEKVIQVEEQRYSEERHELLDKFSKTNSTSPYFDKFTRVICENCGTSDCENAKESGNIYQFYYISDSKKQEVVFREFETEMNLIPLEEGEKPYLLIRKYTSYAIDHNQEPPVECNVQHKFVYELHISEADIKKAYKKQ